MSKKEKKLSSSSEDEYVALYNEGTNLLKSKRLEDALRVLNEAFKLNSTDPELLSNLGTVHLHLGHYDKGLEFLDRALEKEKSPISFMNKALVLGILTRYDDAIQTLESLLHSAPGFSQALTLMMQIKRQKELYGPILQADGILTPEMKDRFRMGISQLQAGKLDESRKTMMEILNSFPEFAEAYFVLGFILVQIKQPHKGIEYLDKAISYKPNFPQAWSNKGMAYDQLNDYTKAIECYDKALEIDPNISAAWNNKGLALEIQNKLEEALECYNKSIELNPDYDGAWANRANTFKKLNKIEQALSDYQKTLKLNPHNESAKENIDQLRVWSSSGREGVMRTVVDARDYCPRCGKKNYTNVDVCQYCGTKMFAENIESLLEEAIELENRGHFEEALVKFVRINNKEPARGDAWFFRGKAHCAIAEFRNALMCMAKAQELGFRAIQLMMYGLMARNNLNSFDPPNLSRKHLKKVEIESVGFFPNEETWTLNGAALQMLGQYEKAYKCYEYALEHNSAYHAALKNKELILSLVKKNN